MPFLIQRNPLGLPSFLRMFGGEGPRDAEDKVRFVVDATPYYQGQVITPTNTGAQVGALPGLTASLTFGQLVRIRQIGGHLVIGAAAATNLTVQCGLVIPGSSAAFMWATYDRFQSNAAAAEEITFGELADLVCPAGTRIWARVSGTAAGADHSLRAVTLFDQLT